jgi:hypothetical protein
LFDKGFDVRSLKRGDELLHRVAVLIVGASDDQIGVRRMTVFDKQRVACGNEVRVKCVVRVDQGEIDLVEHTRQRRGFEFLDLEVFGVVDDIVRRRQDIGRILELDQTIVLEQQERATDVGRIVRNRDDCTIAEFADRLDLVGVRAKRFDVYGCYRNQMRVVRLVEGVEIRLMLEVVDVDALLFGPEDPPLPS